jgi:2-methylcitrate dehydratase
MVAVGLINGNFIAENYENSYHEANPIIEILRNKMDVVEKPRYTQEYLEADKRSIANAIQIFFKNRTQTDK